MLIIFLKSSIIKIRLSLTDFSSSSLVQEFNFILIERITLPIETEWGRHSFRKLKHQKVYRVNGEPKKHVKVKFSLIVPNVQFQLSVQVSCEIQIRLFLMRWNHFTECIEQCQAPSIGTLNRTLSKLQEWDTFNKIKKRSGGQSTK